MFASIHKLCAGNAPASKSETRAATAQFKLLMLPADLVAMVLLYLPVADLAVTARLNKAFYKGITECDALWRSARYLEGMSLQQYHTAQRALQSGFVRPRLVKGPRLLDDNVDDGDGDGNNDGDGDGGGNRGEWFVIKGGMHFMRRPRANDRVVIVSQQAPIAAPNENDTSVAPLLRVQIFEADNNAAGNDDFALTRSHVFALTAAHEADDASDAAPLVSTLKLLRESCPMFDGDKVIFVVKALEDVDVHYFSASLDNESFVLSQASHACGTRGAFLFPNFEGRAKDALFHIPGYDNPAVFVNSDEMNTSCSDLLTIDGRVVHTIDAAFTTLLGDQLDDLVFNPAWPRWFGAMKSWASLYMFDVGNSMPFSQLDKHAGHFPDRAVMLKKRTCCDSRQVRDQVLESARILAARRRRRARVYV
jgi:hypothetical protein